MMKNFTKIILIVLIMGISVGAGAQNYGFYYSGDHYNERIYVPHSVKRVVRKYHNFEWIRTTEIRRGHRKLFLVTLQRNNRFIELTMNRVGDILKEKRYALLKHRGRRSPYRKGYASRKVIYHHDGYEYSRWDEERSRQYSWDWDLEEQEKTGEVKMRNNNNQNYGQRNRGW